MQHVRARITAHGHEGEIHPMYGVMTNASFVERATALQWNYTGDALGILHYVEGDRGKLEARMDEIPEVLGYDVAPAGDEAFHVYVRDATTDSLGEMFGPLAQGGIVVVPPIVYHEDGSVSLSLFGSTEEIGTAVDRVPDLIDVEAEFVGGLAGATPAGRARFSPRQREAVRTALDLGYYEMPRDASQADVAAAMDVAPSTAAEHLRKAESTALTALFEE